ncbi:alpha/beta fold hydrolase [Pontibacter actiniarum]|uniref:AB hydrolase-1 domain-containing protein n=1 Tax=Pontibacter actiniarum TaxID=323450 RepID=A0A1X9YQV3_9BACT|nr:alpha/beta hydrolase [Pontibacter actiniarum]ARS35255.1 hypothetical protein CA264_07280 [Pontibacter actiniarum]
MEIKQRYVPVGDLQLHTAVAGPSTGEAVILLHGFPDAWFTWEEQLQVLAGQGYYAVAPDQRGYNLSSKPPGVENYTQDKLTGDILRLADGLGLERFHLVGHDFGAAVAWRLALLYPQRVRKLVISNVPHPQVMRHNLRRQPGQMLRSSYALFFQLPWLPEKLLAALEPELLMKQMPSNLREVQGARLKQAWSQPGALTSMLNWYRAAGRGAATASAGKAMVNVPTRIIWGEQDPYLRAEMAKQSMAYLQNGELMLLHEAGHWVHHDAAEKYNRYLLDFLRS